MKSELDKNLSENHELRNLINEYIARDKVKYLNNSREKLNLYFTKKVNSSLNQLDVLERKAKQLTDEFNNSLKSEVNKKFDNIEDAHKKLLAELRNEILNYRLSIKEQKKRFLSCLDEDFDKLNEMKIDSKELQKYISKNSFELSFGSSWINKIGIIFILVGVGTAFKYTYSRWFTPAVKGYSFFGLGVLFIALGEYFSKKKKTQFSLGFIGGGIAIFYLSAFFCHFYLKTMGLKAVILSTCIITIISLIMSHRYKSQTVCCLGLAGGNLPILTYFIFYPWSDPAIITAMIYSLILNSAVLIFAYRYQWTIINYTSFASSNAAMCFLVLQITNHIIGIVYSLLIFFIFNFVVALQLKKQNRQSNFGDLIIIIINILINSVTVYLLSIAMFTNIAGLYAACYSLFYLLIGLITKHILTADKKMPMTFFSASIIFGVLFVPLQFSALWIGLGWLVEGLILSLLGLKIKEVKLQVSGICLFAVSLCIFYSHLEFYKTIICYSRYIYIEYFFLKYSSVIAGQLILLVGYIYADRIKPFKFPYSKVLEIYKGFCIVSFYFFIQYYAFKLFWIVMPNNSHNLSEVFFSNILYLFLLRIYIETVFRYKNL